MTSNIIITPRFTLITVLLVKKIKYDKNKLTVNWISTILLFESISQLASRTILSKANLLSSLQHLQTRKHRRQRLLLGKILTGRRDLTSHWLRELSVTDLIAACSGGTAKDVQEETAGERREEERILEAHEPAQSQTQFYLIYSLLYVNILQVLKGKMAQTDNKKFFENLTGAGKSIAVLTSGGDAQGNVTLVSFWRLMDIRFTLCFNVYL